MKKGNMLSLYGLFGMGMGYVMMDVDSGLIQPGVFLVIMGFIFFILGITYFRNIDVIA